LIHHKLLNHELTRIKKQKQFLTAFTGLKHNKNVVDELARPSTKVDYYISKASFATPFNPVNHVKEYLIRVYS